MGNSFPLCVDDSAMGEGERKRKVELNHGARFTKRRGSGLRGIDTSSLGRDRLVLRLLNDDGAVLWRADAPKGSTARREKNGRIPVSEVHAVVSFGEAGVVLVAKDGKTLFEADAESQKVRDRWVVGLSEAAERYRRREQESAQKTKTGYWAERRARLLQNDAAVKEKTKYAGVGMRDTATATIARAS